MRKLRHVYFFQNGNTGATDGSEQIPEAQKSWLMLYVQHLVSLGIDPVEPDYNLPSGRKAKVFRTSDPEHPYSWDIKP